MNKIISLLLLSLIVLPSCEKPYNKNIVNVHAYNALDNSGIEGVYVAVYKEPNGDFGKEKTAADGYTDVNGKLTLTYKKFKLFKAFQLYNYFENEDYKKIKMYRNGVEWNGEGQTGGTKVTNFDIAYTPLCNYKLHVVNSSCLNANDTIWLNHDNLLTGESYELFKYTIGVGFSSYFESGCFDYSDNAFNKINAGEHRFFGKIRRDTGTIDFDTTLFFQPWQDNLIELYF